MGFEIDKAKIIEPAFVFRLRWWHGLDAKARDHALPPNLLLLQLAVLLLRRFQHGPG